MIKVAVVDDDVRDRTLLCDYFAKLGVELKEDIQTVPLSCGAELLDGYDFSYDLICLDIDMKGLNGIEVAKCIRLKDRRAIIVFVTNMMQMAVQGYEVRALDFIVKPVSYFQFALKMRPAISMIHNSKSRSIILNDQSGFRKINSDSLLYVEVRGHSLFYHTTSGTFSHRATLKDVEKSLEGLSFMRCNNCYLVNLRHVDGVRGDDLLIAGESLKISRPRKQAFLQSLANYLGGVD